MAEVSSITIKFKRLINCTNNQLERWQSGRMRWFAKPVRGFEPLHGFESRPLYSRFSFLLYSRFSFCGRDFAVYCRSSFALAYLCVIGCLFGERERGFQHTVAVFYRLLFWACVQAEAFFSCWFSLAGTESVLTYFAPRGGRGPLLPRGGCTLHICTTGLFFCWFSLQSL